MSVALDGQNLFSEHQLEIEIGSENRASVERAINGLDGVLSIDLGARSRTIKQKGVLRARGRSEMTETISNISGYLDGGTHTLVTSDYGAFGDLRMDAFEVGPENSSGNGITVSYEIVYTQLMV